MSSRSVAVGPPVGGAVGPPVGGAVGPPVGGAASPCDDVRTLYGLLSCIWRGERALRLRRLLLRARRGDGNDADDRARGRSEEDARLLRSSDAPTVEGKQADIHRQLMLTPLIDMQLMFISPVLYLLLYYALLSSNQATYQ